MEIELHDDGDAALRGATPEETIWINAVPEPRTVKQRVHLDIETTSLDTVLALGATVLVPASESGFRWDQLADPEGGELCAFVRDEFAARRRIYEMGVDTADAASAHAQAALVGRRVGRARPSTTTAATPGSRTCPACRSTRSTSVPVPEPKTVKNRIHWDITSDDVDGLARARRDRARGAPELARHGRPRRQRVLRLPVDLTVCGRRSHASERPQTWGQATIDFCSR